MTQISPQMTSTPPDLGQRDYFPYYIWMREEGIPIHFEVAGVSDITAIPRKPWPRTGKGLGTFIELDGTYQATGTLPRLAEAGAWTVAHVRLVDQVGNGHELLAADLAAAGHPTILTVARATKRDVTDIDPGSYTAGRAVDRDTVLVSFTPHVPLRPGGHVLPGVSAVLVVTQGAGSACSRCGRPA